MTVHTHAPDSFRASHAIHGSVHLPLDDDAGESVEQDDLTIDSVVGHLEAVPEEALLLQVGNSETASLRQFITAAQHAPMLTLQQEQTYFEAILHERALMQRGAHVDAGVAQKARHARDQLVRSHMRLVISTSRVHAGYEIAMDDLIQEGAVGLLKAIDRFDPANGARLNTYALHWIRAEIQERVIRNSRMSKVATTKAQRKLFFNLHTMKRSMRISAGLGATAAAGRGVTDKEVSVIAARLNVEPHEVREMDLRLSGVDHSLEQILDDEVGNPLHSAYAVMLSDFSHTPDAMLERRREYIQSTRGISQALDVLDARSRHIIESRWLVDEDEQLTLVELAKVYGVSTERVRQIEAGALKKLRSALGESCIVN